MSENPLIQEIGHKIYFIRGKRVMVDRDLAELYGVETKVLNQSVRRNKDRFPEDFMFQMNESELKLWESRLNTDKPSRSQFVTLNMNPLRSQSVILNRGKNIKYAPMVFTEQGVAMLSSVLRSKQAIQVNIQIMRTFTKLREMLATNKELREKIEKLEQKYDQKFSYVFKVIERLVSPAQENKPGIGFRT